MTIYPSLTQPVTANFTWGELIQQRDLSDVQPENLVALRNLVWYLLQPIRNEFGPVHVTSGFRTPEHNRSIGGAPYSQHLYGEAADIVVPSASIIDVATFARSIRAFKVISYTEHIHLSIPSVDLLNHPTPYYPESVSPEPNPETP